MKPVPQHLLALLVTFLCSFALHAAPAPAPEWQGGLDSTVVNVQNPDTVMICLGDTVQLRQTNNVSDAGLTWRPAEGFLDAADSPNPRVIPAVSRYYVVTVGAGEMMASDSVYVQIDPLLLPQLIPDTVVCQGLALSLVQSEVVDNQGTTYDYSPGVFLRDSTVANAVFDAIALGDTTFTVVATSSTGRCVESQQVNVTVTPSRLDIAQADTVFTCNTFGTTTLNATASPGDATVTWSPNSGIIGSPGFNAIEVTTVNDLTYYATAVVNGCPQTDSVAIRVDSLPQDLSLTAEPVKDPYCQGDTFYLLGTIFDVQDYPLIEHDWMNAPGLESPNELYNGVFTASDTFLYQRVTTNGACVDTAEILINVTQPPIPIFDPAAPVSCNGTPFQVTISFDPSGPSGTAEWMDPGNTLSCTDCLDPIITTDESITYMIEISSEGSECSGPIMYSVRAGDEISPTLTERTTICPGDSVRLIVGNIVDGATYTVSGGGQMLVGADATVSPTETTTYTITTDDPNCGQFTQEITITPAPNFEVALTGPGGVCVGGEVTLTATVTPDVAGTFEFDLPAGGDVEGNQVTVTADRTLNYAVSFTDAGNCQTRSAVATVEAAELTFEPDIRLSTGSGLPLGADPSIVRGGILVFTVDNVPDDFGGTFNWSGDGDPSTAEGRTITVTAPTSEELDNVTYTVMIEDPDGCSATRSLSVSLSDEIYAIPEIISANNDGLNDDFQVFFEGGVSVQDFTLIVFNRWGQNVFETSDPTEGWDGTKNGTPQNLDTYLYIARFTVDGREVELDGQFALVR